MNTITLSLKGNSPKLCDSCIHKCIFKDVTLCNIDTNPSLFYYNTKDTPIVVCKDYLFGEDAYPKINIHGIWDWQIGIVIPTPVVVACKHDNIEYEYHSIDELYPHCYKIASDYNVRLKGFPWVINLAEVSEKYGIKKYRTNLISDAEIENIMQKIK